MVGKVLAGVTDFNTQYCEDLTISGSIKDRIDTSIVTCDFEIRYLPKKIFGDEVQALFTQDNPYGLIKAGMLQTRQMLRKKPANAPSRWIPVRKAGDFSTPAPFDFGA